MLIFNVTIFCDNIVIFGEQNLILCLNHILRKSRSICIFNEEETIFNSAFNAENFIKIK